MAPRTGELCVLCRARYPGDQLYSACSCYKKSDRNRLHKECLAAVYANKDTDELPRCSDCHEVYRASVKYTLLLAWQRVCTCRSVGHLLEMCSIVLMMVAGCAALYAFTHSPAYLREQQMQQHPRPSDGAMPSAHPGGSGAMFASGLVYLLFGLTLVLVPFTLRKVFERWRHANSEVEVDIV